MPEADEKAAEGELDPAALNPDIDGALLAFVEIVEAGAGVGDGSTDIGLPITLIVGGSTISGVVTAGKHWWSDFDVLMRSATPGVGTDPEASAGIVEMIADRFRDLTEEKYSAPPDISSVRMVHLRNAKVIHTTGTIPTSEGLLLRVDLAKVEGWALGHLAP